jgi:hypothetical protein
MMHLVFLALTAIALYYTKGPMLKMSGPISTIWNRRMLRTLKAMARRRGEDRHHVDMENWTNHDLRRVVRTGLSKLRVPHNVAEAVLAHRPPSVVGVCDTHQYQDEKAEALEKSVRHLAKITNPGPAAPAEVAKLRGRRR